MGRGLVSESTEKAKVYCYQDRVGDEIRGLCGKRFGWPALCCRERAGPDAKICEKCAGLLKQRQEA